MNLPRLLDDTQGHHLEGLNKLKLVEVGQSKLAAIDRRLGTSIQQWRDGHMRTLREEIADDRLVGKLGKPTVCAARRQR